MNLSDKHINTLPPQADNNSASTRSDTFFEKTNSDNNSNELIHSMKRAKQPHQITPPSKFIQEQDSEYEGNTPTTGLPDPFTAVSLKSGKENSLPNGNKVKISSKPGSQQSYEEKTSEIQEEATDAYINFDADKYIDRGLSTEVNTERALISDRVGRSARGAGRYKYQQFADDDDDQEGDLDKGNKGHRGQVPTKEEYKMNQNHHLPTENFETNHDILITSPDDDRMEERNDTIIPETRENLVNDQTNLATSMIQLDAPTLPTSPVGQTTIRITDGLNASGSKCDSAV